MTDLRRIASACAVLIATVAVAASAQTPASRPLRQLQVPGGTLEYEVTGNPSGEAVILIHGSGVAATFAPTMTEPALAGYRLIRFHRRGYAGSSKEPIPFSVKDQAADARALLRSLNVTRAHVVGHSYGAQIALQLAMDAPDLVRSLVIAEPPIFNPEAPPAAFAKLSATYQSGARNEAMSTFSQMSYGPEWQTLASRVPGGPEQVLRDADTVFESEVPAMTSWRFGAAEGARVTQPSIYVTGGGGHGASLKQLQVWIPKLESFVVPGVTHAMLMQDPKAVADAIAAFLKRHPF
jgi:pimeloyl-ACP methyl ester carboxylesterase